MKGISREVVPYSVDGMLDASAAKDGVVIERMAGLDIFLDPAMVDARIPIACGQCFSGALAALDQRPPRAAT